MGVRRVRIGSRIGPGALLLGAGLAAGSLASPVPTAAGVAVSAAPAIVVPGEPAQSPDPLQLPLLLLGAGSTILALSLSERHR